MHRFVLVTMFLVLSACNAWVPDEVVIASSTNETAKNEIARQLVDDVRQWFGSDAILTIGSRSPGGYDFTSIVRNFAARAAVGYSDRAPDFVVVYELEEVDGFWTGPDITNYLLTASLVRAVSANQGAEIILTSSYRGRCRDASPELPISVFPELPISCESQIDTIAEAALYSLRRP